jgi:hypothetical protein
VQQGTVQVAGRWFSTPDADTSDNSRRFLTERAESIANEAEDEVNREVQEEQVRPPSASPSIAAGQQLPSSNNGGAVPAAATPTSKEPPGAAGIGVVSKAPTSPPSPVPTISVVPTTAAPTVIRMDLLALRLGLVKVEGGGGGSPDRRRRNVLRRQQQQPPWGLRLLQNENFDDNDHHPYEAAVLDALNDFLCKDANIVAVRDACPNPAKPLQVASAHEDSATHLVSHEPVVTVEPVLPSSFNFTKTTTTTTLRAFQWTVQYPLVIAYGLGGYDDAALEVFQDRVQALLNRKMGSNSSQFYRQIYNATGGYRPAIVAPNVTNWVDPYLIDESSNNGSTGNGTLPPDNSTNSASSAPSYDPSRLEPLRLAGIFLLVLTLDAYAVLLWLARRRRRRKVILEHQEQHDRDHGGINGEETVGFIAVPNTGVAAGDSADATREDESDMNRAAVPASPPALLSPTFEGVSTSSSSTSSDANKPQQETHEAPNEAAELSNTNEVRQPTKATATSADAPTIPGHQEVGDSRAEPSDPEDPEESDLPPTKKKLFWFI